MLLNLTCILLRIFTSVFIRQVNHFILRLALMFGDMITHGLPERQDGLLASKSLLLELLAPKTPRRNFPPFLASSLLSGQPLPSPSYMLEGDFRVSR